MVAEVEKYNWDEIKKQIELGELSLKEIAEKYKPEGTNFQSTYDYIRKKKQKKGWEEDEQLHKKFTDRVTKKVVEDETDKKAKIIKEYEKIVSTLRNLSIKAIINSESFKYMKKLKITSEIIHNCKKDEWDILQIKEMPQRVKQEITGKDGGPIAVNNYAQMSDEELMKEAEKHDIKIPAKE